MLDKVNLQNTINWRNILLVRVMYKNKVCTHIVRFVGSIGMMGKCG